MRFAPQDKIALHPQFSAYLAGKKVYPVNVEISPCGICQASCEFCFYANTGELGSHRNVMLDANTLFEVMDEMAAMGVKSISWTGGGEPSLHPKIDELVAYANKYFRQGMFTNALAMPKYNPVLMSWIRVTMTDKPYNLKALESLRGAKTLGFAFNYAGPQDDAYLQQTLAAAEACHADYVQVRPALKFHGQTVDIEPPTINHDLLVLTDYKFREAKKKHGYKTCEAYHFSPMIWEDGNVDTCAYMRQHEGYTLGNIYKESFKAIMDKAPNMVPVHEQCQVCCRLHEMNLSVKKARDLEDKDFP